jgi:homoserine kinase type II
MAVFTQVSFEQAQHWLSDYDVGRLQNISGIASGIENSNFFVSCDAGEFVLTLFERLSTEQLPFYLGLMDHLAADGVACPAPLKNRAGQSLGSLNGKPAALVTRLPGSPVLHPQPEHCRQIGHLLWRMHKSARTYRAVLPNQRGLPWWIAIAPQVSPHLDLDQRSLLFDELAAQQGFASSAVYLNLESSAVHADLFRDNVLFEGDALGGAIDFYFAGTDHHLFDLAVTCNDWCSDNDSGRFDSPRLTALLEGYVAAGGHQPQESAWPMMLRGAAFRFWLSRLYDFYLPRPAEMVTPKDPSHFERILRERRNTPAR